MYLCKGFILLIVLIFMQMIALLGLYSLSASILLKKMIATDQLYYSHASQAGISGK